MGQVFYVHIMLDTDIESKESSKIQLISVALTTVIFA